jgi:hypothetical protein
MCDLSFVVMTIACPFELVEKSHNREQLLVVTDYENFSLE